MIYIEPYPKSMTKNLYEKMVSIDQGASDDDAVMFSGFVEIAPRKYLTLFEKPERKDEKGFAPDWEAPKAIPRLNPEKRIHFPAHRDLEAGFTDLLEARAEELGLIPPSIST